MVALAVTAAVLLAAFGIGVWRESRRFGLGLLLTAALSCVALLLLQLTLSALDVSEGMTLAWVLAGVFGLFVLAVATLGGFLIVNAVTMRRKEGLGLPMLLSGALGAAILGYVTAGVVILVLNRGDLIGWMFMAGLPAAYVAFLFVSYLMYSALYQWGTRRYGAPVSTVVVLGSGLGGGERVTPLLAGRLERGRAVFDRSVEAGAGPILIASGGRGSDEKLSEAEAMSRWLLERGFPPDSIVREDLSTDTEENLANSAELMRQWSSKGDVAVATSDYHALRAAIIMRKAGIPGYTVGCRTARYYWPSATVREFLAILLEHSRLNLAIIVLLAIPLVTSLVRLLAELF